ncbi:MAG: hypothetical protein L3J87_01935 [Thermoplasmata archaeon]|nr:hypothetical protein [Thermoplasmata archaeon]MCI4344371.1 hypothetical protein [Thermoplasmata archaeon]
MAARSGSIDTPAGRRRCRCGHFPTHHMRVLPVEERHGGSFRLDPSASCAICGELTCPKFTPTG